MSILFGMTACVVVAGGSSAWAVAFPDPVDGVVTLNVESGSVTYDAALGNVTMLVKKGAGEAVLSAATDQFSGQVEVQAGTLKITNHKALGKTSPITVSDGATFWFYATDGSEGSAAQGSDMFAYHTLTICGTGVNGQGALRLGAPAWRMFDRAFGTLNLTGDASMQVNCRYGFRTAINPNGHKLTVFGGDNLMVQSMGTLGKGTVDSTGCTVTLQGPAPAIAAPAETFLNIGRDKKLTFWGAKPINLCLKLFNGWLQPDSGAATLLGPVTINENGYFNPTATGGKDLILSGPLALNTTTANPALLCKRNNGKLYLNGPITTSNGTASMWQTGIRNTSMGWIIMTTKVDRVVGYYTAHNVDGGIGPKLWLGDGTLHTRGMLRIGNGGDTGASVWQTGGVYMNNRGDEARIGESSRGYGAYVLDGGEARFSNVVFVAENADSRGLVRQKSGIFEVNGGTLRLGHRGRGEFYSFGGTAKFTNVEMSRSTGDGTLRRSTLVLSGAETVATANQITLGCPTNNNSTVVTVFKDGAKLSAQRYQPLGGKVYLIADKATLMPTIWGGWGNKDYSAADFTNGAPTKSVILSGGLTIDTSDCYDWSHTQKGNSWMALIFTAPTGKRIAKISLPTDSAFTSAKYFAPSMVTITGNGWGATAFAEFDYKTEKITGITITSGGCDYDENTMVTLLSPDGKSSYSCAFELAENGPGGALTKRGQQELILTGDQTYTGGTIVEEGLLNFVNYNDISGRFPANTPLTVKRGARFSISGREIVVSKISGEGTVTCSKATVGEVHVRLADLFDTGHTALTCSGDLVFASGAKVVVDDPENFTTITPKRAQTILTAKSLTGSVAFESPAGVFPVWTLRRKGNTLTLGPQKGLSILVK